MKPHDQPSRRVAERRVRSQLDANLGWVGGWPLGRGSWQVVPPPGKGAPYVLEMSPAVLAQASRCWAKTTGPHREAFLRSVPRPAAWETVVPQRLQQARTQVDGASGAVPTNAEEAVRSALAISPDLDAALAWCRVHRAALAILDDPVRQVQVAWLGARHGAAVDPLFRLLTGPEPALYDGGVLDGLRGAAKRGTVPPDLPVGAWRALLVAWLDTAWGERDAPRALALHWLPLALPLPLVEAFTIWWEAVTTARRAVQGLAHRVARKLDDSHTHAARARARAQVAALPQPPPRLRSEALAETWVLARAGVHGASGVAWLAVRGLARPAGVVKLWARYATTPLAARVFQQIAVDLADNPEREALWPKGADGPWWGPGLDALDQPDPSGAWAFARLLHGSSGLSVDEVDQAMLLHTLDPSRAGPRAVAVRRAGMLDRWLPDRSLKLAARVARDDADGFAGVLALLEKEGERVGSALLFLGGDAVRMGRLVGRKPLRQAAADLDLGRVLGCAVPPWPARTETALPAGLVRYPSELHPALRWLAGVHPDPAKGASAVLDSDCPPLHKLQAQLDVLRQRDDPKLTPRIRHLEQWLAEPPALSSSRLNKLQGKLVDAALRATFASWFGLLRTTVGEARAVRWGDSPGLDLPRTTAILAAVAQLSPPYRSLVDRLLQARNGPRPWDLRDDPVHGELLRRWRAMGIDPGPWLDPPVHSLQMGDTSLEIAAATDPLDVLWMGGAFDTCLSPGQFNFFSAVTNAADVDKHVVAAWRGGEMVARALVAVDQAGALLIFQPYGKLAGFNEAVGAWAAEVAHAMGTVVGRGGTVRPRLAPGWYDDGVVDLSGEVGFLGLDAAFAAAHAEASPEAFVGLVEAKLGPIQPLLARAVVGTQAVRAHPRWVLGLLPWLSPRALDAFTARHLALLLVGAGHPELAWTYGHAELVKLTQTLRDGWVDAELVELWVQFDPVAAQRALRRSPRRLDDLRGPWAAALRALGRHRQAAQVDAGREP